MNNNILQLNIESKKTILSSQSHFYKTENFIKQTKYVSNIDILLTKICETLILNFVEINDGENFDGQDECFFVQTNDKQFSFLVNFGYQQGGIFNKKDIIFFDYVVDLKKQQLSIKADEYLNFGLSHSITIKKQQKFVSKNNFAKLYLISNISGINLPKLTKEQQEIVETIDKNVLVQGVAGSGKTNICIDKIIFTACRNFGGKTLYTTFSRGLLIDTKLKVEMFKKDLENILEAYQLNQIKFLDENHKKALENRLGIYFFSDDDEEIFAKIEKIIDYLSNKVDYLLVEDLYKLKFQDEKVFVGQDYFLNDYSNNLENYQIEKCFNKLAKYSKEIIYKEIYGMIFGYYNLDEQIEMMPLENYIKARQNSFSQTECENIYQIALDLKKCYEKNNLIDNNFASKKLINEINNSYEYSLSIVDEVQDYTHANLCLFKAISLKLFCVGDALQMINPAYFSFGYLKNLMYEKDVTEVKQLQYNYRNTAKIASIIDALGEINRQEFGTHNFLLKGQSVENDIKTKAILVQDGDFAKQISNNKFDNFTFIVSSEKEKKELKKIITNQEVLTVSEIKGLERDTVVAYHILSSSDDKWQLLQQQKVNHKQADENSVYRYYYNLFYVALSRAKQNVFVVEPIKIRQFENFFRKNFDRNDTKSAIAVLDEVVSKVEFTQNELLDRVNEFIKLEQFDNARFIANKIKDDAKRIDNLRKIEVYEKYIHFGKHREAGIKFWEYGLNDDAKKQFMLSNDKILIDLIDKLSKNSKKDLDIDIINYYDDVKDNMIACEFIVETVKNDIAKLRASFGQIKENFKSRSKKIGK